MADLGLVREAEELAEHALARETRHRQRCDELSSALGQDGAHLDPPLAQAADELERLIGGDAASDDQQDAFGCCHEGLASSPRLYHLPRPVRKPVTEPE